MNFDDNFSFKPSSQGSLDQHQDMYRSVASMVLYQFGTIPIYGTRRLEGMAAKLARHVFDFLIFIFFLFLKVCN